jgi:hypothetical protein
MPFGVKIEKDQQVEKLRQQVDFNLHNIALEMDPNYFTVDNQEVIKFVSFEDALKELVALKNS